MQRPQRETVTLEDIVITEELPWRNPRVANLHQENQALHALARQLVNQPQTMLQNLVDITQELCNAGTVGVSLLEVTANGEEVFRAHVLAGALAEYVGGTTPRNFSPCGTCLDRGSPQLYSYPDRYFTYLQAANTPIVEGLVLPLIADNHALGTIWILSHDEQRHFDSEDVRVMTSLADFAAAALLLNQRQTQELLAKNVELEAEAAERKRAEELAKESEAYFHAIANLVPDMLWRSDPTGKTGWYNQRWLEYTGQTLEEAQGYGWLEVIHPGDRAQSLANFQKAVDEGLPLQQEHRIRDANGNYRWFEVRAEPVFDGDGRITQWFGAAIDIHEQRTATEQLRESEARLRGMIENLPGGAAFVVDRNLRYLLAEGEALHTAGFKNEDLVGKTIFEVLSPELAANYEVKYRKGLAGEPFEHEHNAHDRTYVSRGTPLYSQNGEVYAVLAVSYDITVRKQAEAALRESEGKYRSLFESIDEGFCIFEMIYDETGKVVDYRFLEVNSVFEQQTGLANAVGKLGSEIAPNTESYWLEAYDKAIKTGKPQRIENYSQSTDRWYSAYASRVGSVGSRQVCAVFSDITDRKKAEAALQESEERQAYLLRLSDALRPLSDPIKIQWQALNIVGEYLDLDRVLYNEIDPDVTTYTVHVNYVREGFPSYVGSYPMLPFAESVKNLRLGKTYVIYDVENEEQFNEEERAICRGINVQAFVVVPLIKQGQWVVNVVAHYSKARNWTQYDVSILEETAERTWAAVERARAEEDLRQSEVKYRSLFESIDEGYALCEVMYDENERPVDVRYLEVNPAFEQLTGLENVAGKTVVELLPSIESFWIETSARVAQTGEATRVEEYAEGLNRWLDVYFSRVGGEGSRQVAVVFNDISERKRTEEQLRRAAELDAFRVKLSDALRSLTDPGTIQEAACRVLGEHLELDRVYYSKLDWDRRVVCNMQDYYRSESPQNDLPSLIGEYDMSVYAAHVEAWSAGRSLVVGDVENDSALSEGERVGLMMYGIRAVLSTPLVKNGTAVVVIAAISSVPRQWTAEVIALLEETANRTWDAVQRATAEVALRESEIQRIQEQSAREEERQRAESLAELDRAKTLFFSNVSHEFRTPLTLLLAPVQDALSDSVNPLAQAQRERLELVHRNTMRLLKLVNTLLDFSRIEAGRMEAVYEPTDLAMFTAELASVFRSAIEQAGLRLVVDCPPLAEPVYVDREMWEKIVLNLLSNAFKFTFLGEITLRLHLADDYHVTLQVEDTGAGIEPEELPHLFERFYQVRKAKARTHEGSGIGLALVHELIKLHGGTIEVSSTIGVGSCFTVKIPLGTAHLPTERIQAPRTLASTALGAAPYVQEAERWLPDKAEGRGQMAEAESDLLPPAFRVRQSPRRSFLATASANDGNCLTSCLLPSKAHVLIVDDNADMRDYLKRILSDRFEVQAVADGAAALAAVNQQVPDLVLSDVMMPGLDGFELLKALRADARTKEVPIILLSARAGEESVIEGLLAGADDYLIKPFSANELVTRVNAYLQMAHLRSETLRQERTINHRKDEVLSTVSHELNTPLVAILGWTRLLRSSPPNPAMLMKSLETIERNATLQAKLVQDLLDISRITAGKIHLNLEPVELQGVIENAIATVRQSLETKNIHLDCLLDPLPRIVPGDPERLQQIMINLLTNTVKFTPEGGRIKVSLQTHENEAQITITDTGCGIDGDLLPHIFDSFRQAQGARKGLGLGLAIARSLVQLHGGTIHAESPGVGQGATFTVRLPFP